MNGDGPGIAEDSNDKGEFAFVGLPPGRYFLLPSDDKWASTNVEPIELLAKDVTNVRVRVRPRTKVTGHVEPRQQCTISHEPAGAGFGDGEMPMFVAPRPTEPNGDFELPVNATKAKLTARCSSGAYGTKDIDPKANNDARRDRGQSGRVDRGARGRR